MAKHDECIRASIKNSKRANAKYETLSFIKILENHLLPNQTKILCNVKSFYNILYGCSPLSHVILLIDIIVPIPVS